MSLINEMQICAERDDVVTVLRKALRLSSKLGIRDMAAWIDHELDGYPITAEVPVYRMINVDLYYDTNGYVPAGFGMLKNGVERLNININHKNAIRYSASKICESIYAIKNGKGMASLPLGPDVKSMILRQLPHDPIADNFIFYGVYCSPQIIDIPEQIKNIVLRWACRLERFGVIGADDSFSQKEKDTARTVVFNISECDIQQISDKGENVQYGKI